MAGQEVGGYNFSAGLSSLLGNVKSGESTVADSPKSEPSAQPGDGKLKISGEVAAKFERMNQEFDRILESWADKLGIQHGELKTHLDRVRLAYEIASALQKSDPAGYQDFLKQVETAGAPFKVNLGLARSEDGKSVALNSAVKLDGDYSRMHQQMRNQVIVANSGLVDQVKVNDLTLNGAARPDAQGEFKDNLEKLDELFGAENADKQFRDAVNNLPKVLPDAAGADREFQDSKNMAAESPAGSSQDEFGKNVRNIGALLPTDTAKPVSDIESQAISSQLRSQGSAKSDLPSAAGEYARESGESVNAGGRQLDHAKEFIAAYEADGDRRLDLKEVTDRKLGLPSEVDQMWTALQRHIEQNNGGKPLTAEELAAFFASQSFDTGEWLQDVPRDLTTRV